MMVHVTLLSLMYQTLLVLIGNAAAKRLSRIRAARIVATRLAGLALIGFGVRLALDGR
jgi:threonine/homoserine/homoserine lactone efflux protein